MAETHSSGNFTQTYFIEDMTRQDYGKYVLVYLGLGEVHRFSKPDSAEYIDVLMPQDLDIRALTFTMLRAGGRIDRGPISSEMARNVLETMAPEPNGSVANPAP